MTQQSANLDNARRVAEFIASRGGKVPRGEVITGLGLTAATSSVTRWLKEAAARGLIEQKGEGRKNSAYVASALLRTEAVEKLLAVDVGRRARAGYVPDLLADHNERSLPLLDRRTARMLASSCPAGAFTLARLSAGERAAIVNDLAFTSARLAGNSYEQHAVMALLAHRIPKPAAPRSQTLEVENLGQSAQLLFELARAGESSPSALPSVLDAGIRQLHVLITRGFSASSEQAGRFRVTASQVDGSTFTPLAAEHVPQAYRQLVEHASRIRSPYEQSFFLLTHLTYLRPFATDNEAVARLASAVPLLRAGIAPASWFEADPSGYQRACIALYEFLDTKPLESVFVRSIMDSADRLAAVRLLREPSEISTKYARQVQETIRARIVDDCAVISPTIATDDLEAFLAHVDAEAAAIVDNPLIAVRYGLPTDAVDAWRERQPVADDDDSIRPRDRQRGA